jgi:hypothetical protein
MIRCHPAALVPVALEPATYAMPLLYDPDDPVRAVVDIPDGYFSAGGWVVDPARSAHRSTSERACATWPTHSWPSAIGPHQRRCE